MTGPVSSNWFYYMTMASMAQAAPSINQTNAAAPMGGMPNDNSLFMMILNAAMQNMQPASEQTMQMPTKLLSQTTGSFTPIQVTIKPLETETAPASQAIDTRAVPTSPQDTSDFGFKPVQFIKLENTLDGKLSGAANHFINAGKKYDINPNLLSAIAIHETGNGSSNAVNQKNNVAGMMGKNGLRSYDSIEDSIFDMARNLRKNYLNQGKDTIAAIGAKYAPVGAANDPTGLNNHWTQGVSKQFNNLA
ncbi:glucosaminidase domain-containing protein [Planococcus ruber]|uniref:glucosaminidase domain-containing protein n=1 Tax=Planococcus ruber TaxID=2027871 RepID=UPI001FF06C89|nr:glucosaminidase domain-containing protein [Planococcus ruber]MCJ1909786.1 glucosaminidase domain-containing protein [Planococcus ruber]